MDTVQLKQLEKLLLDMNNDNRVLLTTIQELTSVVKELANAVAVIELQVKVLEADRLRGYRTMV